MKPLLSLRRPETRPVRQLQVLGRTVIEVDALTVARVRTLFRRRPPIAVSVTPDHAANGKPLSPSACPVALAIREATGASDVLVGNSVAKGRRVVFVAGHGYFRLPKEIAEKIERFDLGGEFEPCEFALRRRL